MSIQEATDALHSLGNAWEQFKQVNDQRLRDIERKGNADPLYDEHLRKINHALDQHKHRLEQIETAHARPDYDVPGGMPASFEAGEYRKAFRNYLRKGMDAGLEQIQLKALSVGTDADGGYLVTPQMATTIAKVIAESSPMRALASIETISSDSLDLIEDTGEMAASWVTETGDRNDTTTAQIGKNSIDTHEMYAQPKATQKLIDDASIDIEGWVAQKVAEKFARLEATSFISGDGSGKPKGILTYAAGTSFGQVEQVLSGDDGEVTADSLVKLYYALKDEYAKRATFLMHRTTVQSVRLLKESTTDQYLWQPGLAAGTPDTLLGVPVALAADMPVPAEDSLSIALGDFKAGYLIVDRVGIRTLRDPFTSKPFVKFYTTKRVGGEVINSEAIKLLKLAVS